MIDFDGVPLALPEQFSELRPHQVEAIREIRHLFKDRKVIFLDAPTGAGKTLIGEVTRQLLGHDHNLKQGLYVCTTLSLQDQFLHDFPYAKLIKGRSNYPTRDEPEKFKLWGERQITAADCTKAFYRNTSFPLCDMCEWRDPDLGLDEGDDSKGFLHCHHCHPWQECPYEKAKRAALTSPLAVANLAYYLTEANYINMIPKRFGAVIVDEGDMLEQVLMGQVELSLSKRQIKAMGLPLPEKKTVVSSWVEWCQMAAKHVGSEVSTLATSLSEYTTEPPPKPLADQFKQASQTLEKVKSVHDAIVNEPNNWVLDGLGDGRINLKPVEVSSFGQGQLWRHASKFLVMSATLISPFQMASDLGLKDHEWEAVRVESRFPIERRKVIVRPVASVTRKTMDAAVPKMVAEIADILDAHHDERVLIHTVSYALTEDLRAGLTARGHGHRLYTYDSARGREEALAGYRRTHAAVLLAPSFDRGIDLPDDECRVIIVAKMPFPNLGDAQVNKRLYGTRTGKSWFAMQTVRSLVQMTGRGMRHKDDYVTTYILDSQFQSNIWKNNVSRNLIPRWWSDAIVREPPKRRT